VHLPPDSESIRADDALGERVDTLAAWLHEIDARVRAAEVATGGEKTAKELRKAIEALAKHDPKLEDRLTNRVNVVTDRLATLAATVSTTAAALARKDGEIATLRRELEDGNAKIEALVGELHRAPGAADVEELRRAIAGFSADRPKRKGDNGIDGLSGKVDVLVQRLDMLATTVSTTAAGLAGREGDVAALRRKLEEANTEVEAAIGELRRSVDPRPVSELRETVKALSDETSALKRSGQRRFDGVCAKIDGLTERLDSLAKTVATTANGLAGSENEVVALRAAFDEENERVDALLVKLHRATGALSSQMADLDGFVARDTVDELSTKVEALTAQMTSLGAIVETTATGHADKELEIAALSRRFEDRSSQVDGLVRELRAALETMPEPGVDPEFENRFDELSEQVDAVTSQLAQVDATSSMRARDAASSGAELERLLAQVAERLGTVERDRDAAAAEVVRAAEAWAAERESVQRQLEALASAQAGRPEAVEGMSALLQGLTARLDAMEHDRVAVAAEIARVSVVLDTERTSLQGQLNVLAAALEKPALSAGSDESEHLLAELAERLDGVKRDGAAVASEVAQATAFWSAALGSIEARLDEVASTRSEVAPHVDAETERLFADLAGRLEAMERDRRAAHAPAPTSFGAEVTQLPALMDDLRMRLASNEKELATLAGSRDVVGRLDELTWRLDALEKTGGVVLAPSASTNGDGRFRLELRQLELRMEHAEAAARENREAVLVQLERLASRTEWRLQRLETDQPVTPYPPVQAAAGGAQVVPIRANPTLGNDV